MLHTSIYPMYLVKFAPEEAQFPIKGFTSGLI